MTEKDFAQFQGLLKHFLYPAYKNYQFTLTEPEERTWFQAMLEIPYEAIKDAVLYYIQHYEYPPSLATIRVQSVRKVRSRPSQYGLDKAWKEQEVKTGGIPYEVRLRMAALRDQARAKAGETGENEPEKTVDAWGNPYVRKQRKGPPLSMEERLQNADALIRDYNLRMYRHDKDGKPIRDERGKPVLKPAENTTTEPIMLGGHSCTMAGSPGGAWTVFGHPNWDGHKEAEAREREEYEKESARKGAQSSQRYAGGGMAWVEE